MVGHCLLFLVCSFRGVSLVAAVVVVVGHCLLFLVCCLRGISLEAYPSLPRVGPVPLCLLAGGRAALSTIILTVCVEKADGSLDIIHAFFVGLFSVLGQLRGFCIFSGLFFGRLFRVVGVMMGHAADWQSWRS